MTAQGDDLADMAALEFVSGGEEFLRIPVPQQRYDLVMGESIRFSERLFDQLIHVTPPRR